MDAPVNLFEAYRMVREKESAALKTADRRMKADDEPDRNEIVGPAYPSSVRPERADSNPNMRYSDGKTVSPFYRETGRCTAKSGVFSQDLSSVESAIDQGVPTDTMVQSRLIPIGYDTHGTYEVETDDIGLVDALVWQCYMGNDQAVRAILRAGYRPHRRYRGYSPITAAIRGCNLQCLKLVLSVPALRRIVNVRDGFGYHPLQAAATVKGIDPYEFAREVVNAGGYEDFNRPTTEYSALMLSLLRTGNVGWTPNLFSELLRGTRNVYHRTKDGMSAADLAERMGNRVAVAMIGNWTKHGRESLNPAITDNRIAP